MPTRPQKVKETGGQILIPAWLDTDEHTYIFFINTVPPTLLKIVLLRLFF